MKTIQERRRGLLILAVVNAAFVILNTGFWFALRRWWSLSAVAIGSTAVLFCLWARNRIGRP